MSRAVAELNPLYLNVLPRPAISSRTMPRLVENFMEPGARTYTRIGTTVGWNDSPASSPQITWGGANQWVEVSTLAAGQQQVYAEAYFYRVESATYALSFTVESKTGTIGGGTSVLVQAPFGLTGTTTIADPAVGRHVMVFKSAYSGDGYLRFGIGIESANAADATIRYSNIMLEIWVDPATTTASEYVSPGDTRAFPYTRSVTMDGTLEDSVTNGTPYAIPINTSILVIGDSFSDSKASEPVGSSWGDYPYRMKKRDLSGRRFAISTRAVPGESILAITTQLTNALAETTYTAGVAPWTICISQGGINDVIAGRTLAQMQADKMAQIEAINAAGMRTVLVGLSPYDDSTAGQQTLIDGFNAWLKTLGYPMYDLYADANDGSGNYKASWATFDGIHPGTTYTGGQSVMAQRIADIIVLIGD